MSDSPKAPNRPDDQELDDFMAGRGPVSRAYRQSRAGEAAPPELDAPVLSLARQALEQPTPRKRIGWQSLRLPVALVATVVLSFSTFLKLREEPIARSVVEAAPIAAAEPTPAAEVMLDAAPPAQKQKVEPKRALPPALAQQRKETVEKKEQARAPAAAVESEQALRSEAYVEEDSAGSSARPLARKARPFAPATAGGMAANSAPVPAESRDQMSTEPEEWIRQIRELRDSSQTERARAQLESLVKTYPQYVVPEDLKSLLPPPP